MKKKSKHGVSPKGAVILREREKKRRDSLPREYNVLTLERHQMTPPKSSHPLEELLEEYPVSAVLGKEYDEELVSKVLPMTSAIYSDYKTKQ